MCGTHRYGDGEGWQHKACYFNINLENTIANLNKIRKRNNNLKEQQSSLKMDEVEKQGYTSEVLQFQEMSLGV